jgi:hypothetical protein
MTRSVITDMCAQKLTKVLSLYNWSHRINTDQLEEATVERAQMNCVTTCRHRVCSLILHSQFSTQMPQTQNRRRDIIAITQGTQAFGTLLRPF